MQQAHINEAIKELKTIRDLLRFATTQFNAANVCFGHGTDNAWDEAVALIFPTLSLPYDSKPDIVNAILTTSEKKKLLELISLRIDQRLPVAYLTNKAIFADLEFYIDRRVIIPRSPMAELIEQQFSPWIAPETISSILDLCTGSGCIAIACAYQFPDVAIDAVDLSRDALEVAKINAKMHNVEEQVNLIQSDLFTNLSNKSYDVIISNPPYVDQTDMANLPAEYFQEPKMSLAAGTDGLIFIKRILQKAASFLTDEGILIVEVGNSAQALVEQYPHLPFTWLEFDRGESEVFLLTKEQLESSEL